LLGIAEFQGVELRIGVFQENLICKGYFLRVEFGKERFFVDIGIAQYSALT
jgi:hypothetical protein